MEEATQEKAVVLFRDEAKSHPLARYGESRVVRALSDRIMATDGRKVPLNREEAILTAQAAIAYRLDPFGGELWSWVTVRKDGNRVLTVMKGRDGTLKIAKQNALEAGTYLLSPRFQLIVDEAERARYMIPKGALACECFQEDYKSVTTWQERYNKMVDAGAKHDEVMRILGDSPHDWGLGVLTVEELRQLDSMGSNKMTHVERVQKRAHMAALRKRWAAQEWSAQDSVEASLETDDYILEGEWMEVVEEKPKANRAEIAQKAAQGINTLYDPAPDSEISAQIVAAVAKNMKAKREVKPETVEKMAKLFRWQLSLCFVGQDEKALGKKFLQKALGKSSSTDLTYAELKALLDFLEISEPDAGGDRTPSGTAIAKVQAFLAN